MNDPAVLAQRALRERMSAALREGIVTAIDLGDSKTVCVIARVDLGRLSIGTPARDSDVYSALKVIGTGTAPVQGMNKGVVADPQAVSISVRAALDQAQKQARETVKGAIFSLNGGLPRSITAHADTELPTADVDDAMIARLMNACRPELALRLRRPLLAEPNNFIVDGKSGIRDPRGAPARKVSMELAVLTVERTALQAIAKVAVLSGLGVDGVVSSSVASAVTCLTDDELGLGAICIDMGAAVTGFASFRNGQFYHAGVVPIGGERITTDLAAAMDMPRDEAEDLKVRTGSPVSADPSVLGGAGRSEASTVFIGVVRPRLEETFEMIRMSLKEETGRPVVLTGGASRLPGVVEVARAVLGRRVRLGKSLHVLRVDSSVSGPEYSTAFGILAYTLRSDRNPWLRAIEISAESEQRFNGVLDWFRQNW